MKTKLHSMIILMGALLGIAAGSLIAQTPLPVQGRDYSNGLNRTLNVDNTGKLNVNATVSGGGCVGTAGTPCNVIGPTAAGAVIAAGANAVLGGLASPGGRLRQMYAISANPAGSDGNNLLGVSPGLYNGATWDPAFTCPLSAPIAISGSGNTQLVALTASQSIRICNISWSVGDGSAVAVKITTGTGSNCSGSTADVSGVYTSPGVALDFGPQAALRGVVSSAICLNSGTATAIGGLISYAKF